MNQDHPYPSGEGTVRWVSTSWLEDHLEDDMLILDVQPDVHDYLLEHIPGAVHLNERFLQAWHRTRPVVFVAPEMAEAYFRKVGVREDQPVVVYTGKGRFKGWGDGLEQTMMAYSMARYGHQKVLILDGGLDKWMAEGREVSPLFPMVEDSDFQAMVRDDYRIEYQEFLEVKDREDVMVLDARPSEFYEGGGPWGRPGHIPGAVSLPWPSLMERDNRAKLLPLDRILSILERRGVTRDRSIICTCGTGREATNEFTLLRWYLGYPDVRLYEGSYTEWFSYPDNPTVLGKDPY